MGALKGWDAQKVLKMAKETIALHDLAQDTADRAASVAVDTGFAKNSFYIRTATGIDTYGATWGSGRYTNREGDDVKREKAPPAELGDHEALIANAAPYAVYLEIENSFLHTALEASRDRLPRIVRPF